MKTFFVILFLLKIAIQLVCCTEEEDHLFYEGDYSKSDIIGNSLPGTWRPFNSDSPWTKKIPSDAQTHPDNEKYMSTFQAASGNIRFTQVYNPPIWVVNYNNFDLLRDFIADYPFDRWDPIDITVNPHTVDIGLPCVESMYGEPTEDGHMIIIDPFMQVSWEMSKFDWDRHKSGDYLCSTFNVWDLSGIGYGDNDEGWRNGCRGGRGSGYPVIAGLLRPEELEMGEIRHPLTFSLPNLQGHADGAPFVSPPACRSDGSDQNTDYPMYGLLFQLDPSLGNDDFESWGLDNNTKVIAKCLQEYGMYFGERGGGPAIAQQLLAETSDGSIEEWERRFPDIYKSMKKIPTSAFRVVANQGELKYDDENYDTINVTPLIKPIGGEFDSDQEISLLSRIQTAEFYYTLDGSEPTENSIKYEGPFKLSEPCTVKAILIGSSRRNSLIATAHFDYSVVVTPIPDPTNDDTTDNATLMSNKFFLVLLLMISLIKFIF
ncbi:hypothetical protein M0813_12140 [Anaeramoeba flamelloides]|uniref:Uncharacterized protein n=1 Tax=Anaeramoeba flamelloides TaxID=1746091 RepID=A0ABQ8ZCC3_9EUKA|nr:hypothetical protein M0813_12140 [Anaeramoeba flamelloides]